ncbi:MAG TPA: tetratricopeptide repeat protein [Cyclobacteriaceae bacterium]|nr:tetratricopeptide repeat protein [Cyclobacteriaceae bacterium]
MKESQKTSAWEITARTNYFTLAIKRYSAIILVLLTLLVSTSTISYAQKDKRKKGSSAPTEAQLREAEFYFIEAEKHFILEDYAKALLYFQRVSELNPENGTVHYKIAEILSKSNKEEDLIKAAASIDAALKMETKNKYFYLLASSIYSNLTNFAKAAQLLETMMKEVKGTEEYLYQLAAIYQYDNKNDEAIRALDRAESLMGVNEISSLNKQRIYFEEGKIKEAIREGEKLLEAFPDEESYAMNFAEILSRQNQLTKAIEVAERFIATHPDAGNTKMLLAGFYRDNKEEEKAKKYLKEVFSDPNIDVSSKIIVVSTYANTLGQQQAAGTTDTALQAFTFGLYNQLKESYPNEPNVHIVGGDLYLGLEKNGEAKKEYLTAIQKGSTSFDAWQNLLYLESQDNEFDSIIVHSELGLEIFPNQAMLYYFNGFAHARVNNHKEAAYALEQAKRLSTSNEGMVSEINGLLGDIYNSLKDYKKSDESYDAALAFNPNNYLILNNYSYYLALRNEFLEKAERMAALVVKNNPTNNSYLDTYAWVLFTRAKYKDAKKVMEKVIESNPTNSTFFEHYGDILFKLGNVEEAVKQWEKAKSFDNTNELIDKKIANRRLY